jgi:hypothetical protein
MGVSELMCRQSKLWWRLGVVACLSDLAACSRPRWQTLLGSGQCGVGLRRRTALAATAGWDDWACSGPRRVAHLSWAIWCGRRRKRLLWLADTAKKAMYKGEVTRRGRHSAVAWLINGDLGERGNIAQHSDNDKGNGSVMWSSVAGVARPPCAVYLRGNVREAESNSGCGEAPVRCVVVATAAKQPSRGSDSMLSPCQVESVVTVALRQKVLHGGGLLGAVQSASRFNVDARLRWEVSVVS